MLGRLQELAPRKTLINALELMAATGVYESLPDVLLRGVFINHFGDNRTANGMATRGYSSKPDTAMMISRFHFKQARLGTRARIEWYRRSSI